MKKALWGFIAVMALVMALSSCTMAGAPAGMIGIWKTSFGPFEVYIELKDNGQLLPEGKTTGFAASSDIVFADGSRLTPGIMLNTNGFTVTEDGD